MNKHAVSSHETPRKNDKLIQDEDEEDEIRSNVESPIIGEPREQHQYALREDEDEDVEHRALLSSTSAMDARRPNVHDERDNDRRGNHSRKPSGIDPTHVSNLEFMKGIFMETMPTLMFALLGTFLTGELLELLATWEAFKAINELFVLVPMLLNLKGNLEMNLSARLSTASNMGDLDSRIMRRQLMLGNLSLLQVQAILVSCLAATFTFVISLILPAESSDGGGDNAARSLFSSEDFSSTAVAVATQLLTRAHPHRPKPHPLPSPKAGPREFMIVLLIGQSAAALSSFILGGFMCALVLLCRRFNLNPDNIAPATASALGDLLTLALLGISSHIIFHLSWSGLITLQLIFVAIFFFSLYATMKNSRIKGLLREGWTPLIGAMLISSGTGMILDSYVGKYRDYAMVSIAQDGIPGSVGSVYISRLSTALHEASAGSGAHQRGDGHEHRRQSSGHSYNETREEMGPQSFFAPKDEQTRRALVAARPKISGFALFLITIPVQFLFLTVSYTTHWIDLPALWAVSFSVFFAFTVVCAIVLSHYLTILLWNRNFDPDTYALPLQSSLCDLMGQTFLVTCYEFVGAIGGWKVLEGRRTRRR
ncbi:hypothetical protein FRC18_012315 [Serendipita sp. 400]|nr:hypothetical protein FRC18_012315 [Serendipita sp. 400]